MYTILYPELSAAVREPKSTAATRERAASAEADAHTSAATRPAPGRARGDHTLVPGASMAGLPAARALADRHVQVTLLERDTFPATATPRSALRGVQGVGIPYLRAAGPTRWSSRSRAVGRCCMQVIHAIVGSLHITRER